MIKMILKFVFLCFLSISYADSVPNHWFNFNNEQKVTLNVDLFLSSTCPHCQKADHFFQTLEKNDPEIKVHRYYINKDKPSLEAFYAQLQKQHSMNFSVPAIFFCEVRWSGFETEATTGQALLKSLHYCRDKIIEQHGLKQTTINILRQWGIASQFRLNPKIINSATMVIPLTALTDALIPCSLFCLLGLLAFMWLYSESKWQQFFTGIIFVIAIGVTHFVEQTHHDAYYQLILSLRIGAAILGILLLFFLWRNYQNRSIGKFIYYVLIFFTAVALLTFQQFCKLNISLVFEQWLVEQNLSAAQQLSFQLIYQALFLVPWMLLVLFFLLFGQIKRARPYQKLFNVMASCLLLNIACLMIVAPDLLASLPISLIVLLISFGVGVYCYISDKRRV